jgi:hypothetical protein
MRRFDVSTNININQVRQVLLWHWHEVIPDTFQLGTHEYVGQGTAQVSTREAGATWKERNETGKERIVFCPITAIKAVSYGWE